MKGFVDNVTLLQRWCKRFLQVKRRGQTRKRRVEDQSLAAGVVAANSKKSGRGRSGLAMCLFILFGFGYLVIFCLHLLSVFSPYFVYCIFLFPSPLLRSS